MFQFVSLVFHLAQIIRVPVDALFNGNGGTDCNGGPTGKVWQVFERVSRLPRNQHQKVLDILVREHVKQEAQA